MQTKFFAYFFYRKARSQTQCSPSCGSKDLSSLATVNCPHKPMTWMPSLNESNNPLNVWSKFARDCEAFLLTKKPKKKHTHKVLRAVFGVCSKFLLQITRELAPYLGLLS